MVEGFMTSGILLKKIRRSAVGPPIDGFLSPSHAENGV